MDQKNSTPWPLCAPLCPGLEFLTFSPLLGQECSLIHGNVPYLPVILFLKPSFQREGAGHQEDLGDPLQRVIRLRYRVPLVLAGPSGKLPSPPLSTAFISTMDTYTQHKVQAKGFYDKIWEIDVLFNSLSYFVKSTWKVIGFVTHILAFGATSCQSSELC